MGISKSAGPKIFIIIQLLLISLGGLAQQNALADSLLREIQTATEDSLKYNLFQRLSMAYESTNPQFVIDYAEQALALAEKMSDQGKIVTSLNVIGIGYKKREI